jgi:hypothetical protein
MKNLQYIVVLAGIALSSQNLYAQDCQADTDCSDGFICEKAGTISVSSDGTTTETEAEVGYCVEQPIRCQTDEDCPTYLQCEDFSAVDIATGAPCTGEGCTEETAGTETQNPSSEKYCVVREINCLEDRECPSDFVCQTYEIYGTGCAEPAIACNPDDPNCAPPELPPECDPANIPPPEVQGACVPKQVDCVQDSDCPSEWSCVEVGGSSCGSTGTISSSDPVPGQESGSASNAGSDTGTGGATQEAPIQDNGGDTPIDPVPCEPQIIKACMPKGYTSYGTIGAASNGSDLSASTAGTNAEVGGTTGEPTGGDSIGDNKAANTSASGSSSASSEDSSCQASSNAQILWFVSLFSLLLLRRKRTA